MSKELVKQGETALAEKAQSATRALAAWVAKADPSDFLDFRGKLFVPGAQTDKLAAQISLSFTQLESERTPPSGYEEVTADGRTWSRFGWRKLVRCSLMSPEGEVLRHVDVEAMASSDEKTKAGTGDVVVWSVSDHAVATSAYSRACRNAVTRLAGLKALTWEHVQRAGGTKEGAVKVAAREVPDGNQ